MAKIDVQTVKKVVPMIYAYTTPEILRHSGWTKIGYTEQDVGKRLDQQTHTADIQYHEEWRGNAVFEDGSGEVFHDTDFHSYLRKSGIENQKGTEWFHVSGPVSRSMFYDFKQNRGILTTAKTVVPYKLRHEQDVAVAMTVAYYHDHPHGEFLWNAKPRFGKTLSVYDLAKRMDAVNVLVVTNRPAIANSWYSDYEKFLGTESGYIFVSNVDGIRDKKLVVSREEYVRRLHSNEDIQGCIEFVSLQDLKSSVYFGGQYNKLAEVSDAKDSKGNRIGIDWDLLVIDEAHEGVDTYKTDVAFDHINRRYTLHLSGTPFKALANDKFPQNAIYNWTYADEQQAKREWQGEPGEQNPYANLPQLNLFTYQMSEIVHDELKQGIEINGETEEYAFDLNEFFETNQSGKFVHDSSVDKFLDALTVQQKYPFSTPELRKELKHTLWLLNRVDSAKALAKKLKEHPVFRDYHIVLAAGDGKLDENEVAKKSFDEVTAAIAKYDKTITLSVGQLTTGVTIPEWTAVLMLSNVKSPALYMQAAFRAQNPCLFSDSGQFWRKKNAYVFDFDPARTLVIFEEFANDLSADTTSGRGDMDTRKQHVRTLLNFFPVIGEDEQGEMIALDAEKVLSIPRKIRCQEVVRRGFMSNFLFQNISNVFAAPQAVLDIINNLAPAKEPAPMTPNTGDELDIDENGDVNIPEEQVIGQTQDVFGEKMYSDIEDDITDVIDQVQKDLEKPKEADAEEELFRRLKETFKAKAVQPLISEARANYGQEMSSADQKRLERKLTGVAERGIEMAYGNFKIDRNTAEMERQTALASFTPGTKQYDAVNAQYDKRQEDIRKDLQESLQKTADQFVKDSGKEIVKTVETSRRERQKESIEESIRDHLRGFARTIPSFLMAYGEDGEITLATFDQIVPNDVFVEVTSITLEQFDFLRDGGDYQDEKTGETKHFAGHLFDPVVFDDSVKEFMNKKHQLADYFLENSKEDIFDYIPPQKTNQIFTPKAVVRQMVDLLEKENPGCFDQADKTFVDLYMKSGLYITEIVKRLYNSEEIKRKFPDDTERLNHIFAKQVYGLAPTEIIYRIATNYILGFSRDIEIRRNNFRQCDALPYAKEGTLDAKLKDLFPELKERD